MSERFCPCGTPLPRSRRLCDACRVAARAEHRTDQKAYDQLLVERGICRSCRSAKRETKDLCRPCRDRMNENQRARRSRNREEGRCEDCGKAKPDDQTRCEACQERYNTRSRAWQVKQVAEGGCRVCALPADKGTYCAACYAPLAAANEARRQAKRAKADRCSHHDWRTRFADWEATGKGLRVTMKQRCPVCLTTKQHTFIADVNRVIDIFAPKGATDETA